MIRHYRAVDGITGYAPGDYLHTLDTDDWAVAVQTAAGVQLEPATRHDALVAALVECYRAAVAQGYTASIAAWRYTAHDEAWIVRALGTTPTADEWIAAERAARGRA